MWYVFICEDKPNTLDLRMATRPAHVERLNALKEQGRLFVAGPCPAIDNEDPGPAGFTGSVVIAEFSCLEDAQQWANDEPYLAAGVYESVIVKPFKKVLP
ncbi:YciI family protein [Eionea flava]